MVHSQTYLFINKKMKKIINFLGVILIYITLFSCSKSGGGSNNTSNNPSSNYLVDPNNYFTATFSGKTLKTSGMISSYQQQLWSHGATVNTTNSGSSVFTSTQISVTGSHMNSAFTPPPINFPVQGCDASVFLRRTGNSIGSYKLSSGFGSTITDATVGNKTYDIDNNTSTFTITSVDATTVIGYYSGNLIDGSKLIPVSGIFKLRKM